MRNTLAILMIAAAVLSTPSVSALAGQGLIDGTCSNVRVGNATFFRCKSQNTRDFLLPKSGSSTDPAALGKPYGSWGSSFGGQSWSPASGR